MQQTYRAPENIAKIQTLTPEQKQIMAATPEAQALEEAGVFEPIPTRTELDIEREKGIEELPVIGPSAGALTQIAKPRGVLGIAADKGWFGLEKEGVLPLMQDPETLREMALQEIQKEVIAEGTSKSEKFGAFIESIPVVGSLAAKYARGLVETPGGNVQTILAQIDSERERASVIAEKAMTGRLGDPFIALDQIGDIEDNIIRLEMRIKLLAMESATLRADADTVNRIEEKILRAKERVFIAKQIAGGGAIETSTDASLYLELQKYKG